MQFLVSSRFFLGDNVQRGDGGTLPRQTSRMAAMFSPPPSPAESPDTERMPALHASASLRARRRRRRRRRR
eukprot:203070-Rhodomonas_salina.1